MARNQDLNGALRQIFAKTLNDGHRKNHVCALTLGSQCVPQFDGFLKGRNFGIKPMERVLNAFDYELHLVPVHKDDTNTKNTVTELFHDCTENIEQVLITSLDNESLKVASGRTSPLFKEVTDGILKDIGIEPIEE